MARATPSATKKTSKTGTKKKAATKRVRPVKFSTYKAALAYLEDRTDLERVRPTPEVKDRYKLDRFRALLRALDDPQSDLRCVHVAGSKGKGSTVAMTASCLQACGYVVGSYTSPHLVDVRERVTINGAMVPQGEFTRLMGQCATAAKSIIDRHGEPTFFELMTALAFLYFAEKAVDIAVVECGLGGRLDCTNVVNPDVSIITAISLDHTQILGSTLDAIAREKAGIMRKDVPVLTLPQDAEVMAALKEEAEKIGAPLHVLGEDVEFSVRFESSPELGPHRRVCVTSPRSSFEHLPAPLPGEHQALNCGLALSAVDFLRGKGFDTPEARVGAGLARTRIPGRMELVWTNPRIILDGAHNAASLAALVRSIGAHVQYDSMVMVFGCSADKDVDAMLEQIALGADKLIFTKSSSNPRAADPADLQKRFTARSGKMTQSTRTLGEALTLASRAVSRGDLIVVTGSFYLVGEAKLYLADLVGRRAAANGGS